MCCCAVLKPSAHRPGCLTRACPPGVACVSCGVRPQVCISTVLQRHGALALAFMLTTRQFVSVLLSTLFFGHALSLIQWCAS